MAQIKELSLFSGAGGGLLGTTHLLGWQTVCYVEWDRYCAKVLSARIEDGFLHDAPIWDDVQSFDGRPWRGYVDVISGGFPCQDISVAGKGAGIEGEKSGMWKHFARIIRDVRPRYVYVENSPALTFRGLDAVLRDLAALGYDAEWGVLGADDVGAPHRRKRIWIVADAGCSRRWENAGCAYGHERAHGQENDLQLDSYGEGNSGEPTQRALADSQSHDGDTNGDGESTCAGNGKTDRANDAGVWATEPDVGRVADGVASRMDRLRAIGNGQVPLVAATAWEMLDE